MSIGGWTLSDRFPTVAATAESRRTFVASCVALMAAEGFDGIDLDWEYPVSGGLSPGTPEDRANYPLLLGEFRSQLDAAGGGRLSIAAPAGSGIIANMDVPGIIPHLDWLNLMTYDFHGGWEAATHFNSPLHAGADFPAGESDPNTVEAAVATYLELGVPPHKLVVGLPLYGRAWAAVPATNNGLFQSGSEASGTWEAGVLDYWDIETNYLTRADCDRHWHEAARVPWLFCSDGLFITYDDPESWGHKLRFIEARGLGGAMTWELSADNAAHAMIRTMPP
jgi:chitinase